MMKPMRLSTIKALRLVYESPGGDCLHRTIVSTLIRRGLVTPLDPCLTDRSDGNARIRLTEDGFHICKALFGPLTKHHIDTHMNATKESGLYYVVLWDFELDDSGDVVKDGLVFTTIEAAKNEAERKLIEEIDNDLSSRKVNPVWNVRLRKWGYVAGDVIVKSISAGDAITAFEGVLTGKGEEVLN